MQAWLKVKDVHLEHVYPGGGATWWKAKNKQGCAKKKKRTCEGGLILSAGCLKHVIGEMVQKI